MSDSEPRDGELLALLGRALADADPVPDRVIEGARSAFTWRTIDAELAELVFDSSRESAGVRTEDGNRQMTFQAPGVEIEIVVIDGSSRRIVGQLVPPEERNVELVAGDDVMSARTDRLGRFAFELEAPGPVRLVILGDNDERLIQTEWVLF